MIKAILATGINGEIGKDNSLLWHLPKDLAYFKKVTLGKSAIMGSKTFFSLPFKLGLPNRENYVLSSKLNGVVWSNEGYLDFVTKNGLEELKINMIGDTGFYLFVIGGASIYSELEQFVEEWHITTVEHSYPEADTHFKPDLTGFEKVGEPLDVSEGDLKASVQVWRRVNNV